MVFPHHLRTSLTSLIVPRYSQIASKPPVIPLLKKVISMYLIIIGPYLYCLLPVISKVFEKLVYNQLLKYFTDNNFLTDQYRFRSLHSPVLASLELIDRVFQHLDTGQLPLSVFSELSKAFDTFNYLDLLNILKCYGISNTPLKWFESYLYGRQQFVDFDGAASNTAMINTGVLQGSILGPLLFISYMNDIHMVSKNFSVILDADDANLISPLCDFNSSLSIKSSDIEHMSQQINSEIANIQEWLNVNKVSLNVGKTKCMLFVIIKQTYSILYPK